MKPFLEHLNITSTDVDETLRFLMTAMPEFSVRGEGGGEKAQRWVHVGTEESYLHTMMTNMSRQITVGDLVVDFCNLIMRDRTIYLKSFNVQQISYANVI